MCKTPTYFLLHSTAFYNSRQISEPITGDCHQMTTKAAAAGKVDVSGTKYSGKNTIYYVQKGGMFRKNHSTDSCGQMKYLKSDTLPKNGAEEFLWIPLIKIFKMAQTRPY